VPLVYEKDSLSRYGNLYLLINGKFVLHKLEESYVQNNFLHAKFEEISDRDLAIDLKGVVVAVSRDEFPEADNNEYYWTDLIGSKIYNTSGQYFGIVVNLMETGANAVLVVQDDSTERLIPFVEVYISNVDLKDKKITVCWELDY
jgi:16S rRNA processing protein RimM